jgi:hypothetical protein
MVSLLVSGKRPFTAYSAERLATFFGITIEELFGTPGVITVQTPPPRPLGRIVGYRHPLCY